MSAEDLYSTFKEYKSNPPQCKNPAGTLPMMARKVFEFLHCAKEDLDIDGCFKRLPRHCQGKKARPTAMQLATFVYPDMHHAAAVIQYERDVLVIAKAYYAQEERRQDEAATRAWEEYTRLVHGEPERTEEEEAEYNSVRDEVYKTDNEGYYDADEGYYDADEGYYDTDDEGDGEEGVNRDSGMQFEDVVSHGLAPAGVKLRLRSG